MRYDIYIYIYIHVVRQLRVLTIKQISAHQPLQGARQQRRTGNDMINIRNHKAHTYSIIQGTTELNAIYL